MKSQMICAVKKDIKELLRTKKNLMYSGTLLFLSAFFLAATKFVPTLMYKLFESASHMITDVNDIEAMLGSFFPQNLKANMGVLASDIIIFYGFLSVFSTYNLVVKEIEEKKWIFPIGAGYKPYILNVSKGIVYGLGAALPCVVFYNIYNLVGRIYLKANYLFIDASKNSLVLMFSIFWIVYIAIIMTPIFKRTLMSVMTMLTVIVVAPDVFAIFEFGKYLPTHLLTYLYRARTEIEELVIPSIITVLMAVVLTIVSSKKVKNINVV